MTEQEKILFYDAAEIMSWLNNGTLDYCHVEKCWLELFRSRIIAIRDWLHHDLAKQATGGE